MTDINVEIGIEFSKLKKQLDEVASEILKKMKIPVLKVPPIDTSAFHKSMSSMGSSFSNLASKVGKNIWALAIEGTVEMIKIGVEFDKSMKELSALTGVTGEDLDNFGEKAKELAGKFGGHAKTQVESFVLVLSKLGPELAKSPKEIGILVENINLLSKASGLDAKESAEALISTMNQFNVNTKDASEVAIQSGKIANVLAAGAKEGAAFVPDLTKSMAAVGLVARQAGMSVEETAASMEVLAIGNIKGANAGIKLRNILVNLETGAGKAGWALKQLGTSSSEISSIIQNEGLEPALQKLKKAFAEIENPAKRADLQFKLFNKANMAAGGLMIEQADKLAFFTEKMTDTSTATEQAYTNMSSFSEVIGRIKSSLENIGLDIFKEIGPIFEDVLKNIMTLIQAIEPLLKTVFELIAPIIGQIADILEPLLESIAGLIEPLIEPITEIVRIVLDAIEMALQPIIDELPTLGELLGEILTSLEPLIGFVMQLVAVGLGTLLKLAMPMLEIAFTLLSSLLQVIMPIFDVLLKLMNAVMVPIIKVIETVVNAIKLAAVAFKEWITEAIKPAIEWVKGLINPLLAVTDAIGLTNVALDEMTKKNQEARKAAGLTYGDLIDVDAIKDRAGKITAIHANITELNKRIKEAGDTMFGEFEIKIMQKVILDYVKMLASLAEKKKETKKKKPGGLPPEDKEEAAKVKAEADFYDKIIDLQKKYIEKNKDLLDAASKMKNESLILGYESELSAIDKNDAMKIEKEQILQKKITELQNQSAIIDINNEANNQKVAAEADIKKLNEDLKQKKISKEKYDSAYIQMELAKIDVIYQIGKNTDLKLVLQKQKHISNLTKIDKTYEDGLEARNEKILAQQKEDFDKMFKELLEHSNSLIESIQIIAATESISWQDILGTNDAANQVEKISQSLTDLQSKYKNGEIAYKEYSKQRRTLEKEKNALLEKESKQNSVWVEGLNKSMIKSLSTLKTETEGTLKTNTQKYAENQKEMSRIAEKQNNDMELSGEERAAMATKYAKLTDENQETINNVYKQGFTVFSATMTQMILEGEKADKAIAMSMLAGIKSMLPMLILQILAKFMAANPITGAIAAAATTVILMGLLSAAEAALMGGGGGGSKKGYKKGGYTGDGNTDEYAGPAHKGEFYFSKEKTKKYRDLFESINKTGNIPEKYLKETIKPLPLQIRPVVYVDTNGIVKGLKEVDTSIKSMSKGIKYEFYNQSKNFIQNNSNSVNKPIFR